MIFLKEVIITWVCFRKNSVKAVDAQRMPAFFSRRKRLPSWYISYRSMEVLVRHMNECFGAQVVPLGLNFLITSCVTSLTCVLASSFQNLIILLNSGLYFSVILILLVTGLHYFSELTRISYQFLKECRQYKRKCGREVSNSCQVIRITAGSFHEVDATLSGVVIELVFSYTAMLLINIKNI